MAWRKILHGAIEPPHVGCQFLFGLYFPHVQTLNPAFRPRPAIVATHRGERNQAEKMIGESLGTKIVEPLFCAYIRRETLVA